MLSSYFFDPARFSKPLRFNFYNVEFEYLQGFENLAGNCTLFIRNSREGLRRYPFMKR
jgi:hypothetical protein